MEFLQPSQTALLMDPALLIIDTKRVSFRTSIALLLFYVGSRLYIVLTGVTLWSVTNPLTLFKIRILECVTGWGKI